MNARVCGIAVSVITAGIGLTGCASTGTTSAAYVPPVRSPSMQDDAYIARVEREARMRGIDVVWVNAPRKRDRAAD